MPLMFAQGWIPALGFSRGKFLWEANKTGVGKRSFLIGGFNYFVIFTPNLGEMIQFDWYFSNGLKPPTSILVQPRSSWHFFGIQVYCIIFLWDSRLLLVHQDGDLRCPARLKKHPWMKARFQKMGGKYNQWYTSKVTESEALSFPTFLS